MPKQDEKRYFDLEEANDCIPWLNHTFASVFKLRARMAGADDSQKSIFQQEMDDLLDALVAEGIEVVDIDFGVVNFYAIDDDEEVVLSWQFGEARIQFWHEPFEDFGDRRPLRQTANEVPYVRH